MKKIKVAISVKTQGWIRPRKDFINVIYYYTSIRKGVYFLLSKKIKRMEVILYQEKGN